MFNRICFVLLLGVLFLASCEVEEKKEKQKTYKKETLSGVYYIDNLIASKRATGPGTGSYGTANVFNSITDVEQRENYRVTIIDHEDGTVDFIIKDIDINDICSIKKMLFKNKQCLYDNRYNYPSFNFSDSISVEVNGELKQSKVIMTGFVCSEIKRIFFDIFIETLDIWLSANATVMPSGVADLSGKYVGKYTFSGQTIDGTVFVNEHLYDVLYLKDDKISLNDRLTMTIEDIVLSENYIIKGKKFENVDVIYNFDDATFNFVSNINDTLVMIIDGNEQLVECEMSGKFILNYEGIILNLILKTNDITIEYSGGKIDFD